MSYLPSKQHKERVLKILPGSVPFIIHFIVPKIFKFLFKFDSPRLRVLDLRHPHKTLSYEFDFNANHDL